MSNNRLFVGGLNSSVQKDHLEKLFSEHGQVDDAYVNPSGYGFVTFSDGESAQRAVDGLNGYDFMGQTIRVEVSKPRDGGGRGGSRGGGGGGGYQRRDDGELLFDLHHIILSVFLFRRRQQQALHRELERGRFERCIGEHVQRARRH
jgi:RNA recognition motif-containing protein